MDCSRLKYYWNLVSYITYRTAVIIGAGPLAPGFNASILRCVVFLMDGWVGVIRFFRDAQGLALIVN